MRHVKLIRQWKILKGIAEGIYDTGSMGRRHIAKIFKVDKKTIWRDLMCLKEVGFLENNEIVRAKPTGRPPKREKIVPVPKFREIILNIEKLGDAIGIDRCNRCGYRFKQLPNGENDMRDFKKHRTNCEEPPWTKRPLRK